MPDRVQWFLLDGPPERLVRTADGQAFCFHDGQWHESAALWRRVMGIGGDADSHEISATQAAAYMREHRIAWEEPRAIISAAR